MKEILVAILMVAWLNIIILFLNYKISPGGSN